MSGTRELDGAARLTGTLNGVRSLTVDAKQACLRRRSVQVDVKTDVPATLRLSDGRTFELRP